MRSDAVARGFITLSPSLAQRLADIVDKLTTVPANRLISDNLGALQEKLADAAYIGGWLRDYARVDLSHTDVVDSAQALAAVSDAKELSTDDRDLFCKFVGQLTHANSYGFSLTNSTANVEIQPVAL